MKNVNNVRVICMRGIAAIAVSAGCSTEPAADPVDSAPQGESGAYHERDFVRLPTLSANLGTSVVLDLEAPGRATGEDTGTPGVDVIPYRLAQSESLRICLKDIGTALSDATLLDAAGKAVLKVDPKTPCATEELAAGAYSLRVTRGAGATPNASEAIFVHAGDPPPIAPQCTAEEMTTSPLSGTRADRWEFVAEDQGVVSAPLPKLVTDARSKFDPATQGFRLSLGVDGNVRIASNDDRVVAPNGSGLMMLRAADDPTTWVMTPVPDGARWTYGISKKGAYNLTWEWFKLGSEYISYSNGTPIRMTLAMRYVEDGSTIRSLQAGEVAVFERCDYAGKAWVFNDASAFPNAMANIKGFVQPQSAKVGCGTTLLTHPSPNFGGNATRIAQNTRCNAFPDAVAYAYVRKTRDLTIERNLCTNCDLRKVDLRGLDLSRVAFRGGSLEKAHFEGSTLSNATFDDVSLREANFDDTTMLSVAIRGTAQTLPAGSSSFQRAKMNGATLTSVDFDRAKFGAAVLDGSTVTSTSFNGATLDQASFLTARFRGVGFTNTDLRLATLSPAPDFGLLPGQALVADPCAAVINSSIILNRFAGTHVYYAQIPTASWRYVDFTDSAVELSNTPASARTLVRQNLCGLKLGGFNFEGFKLGEARLDYSDLARASFVNADLSFATLNHAVLNSASFLYSDLTSAVLDDVVADAGTGGATFDGTLFLPTSLRNAHFTRVLMNRATVKMPAGVLHDGAIFDGAFFENTDFSGSDLSGLSMLGANFSGATMTRTTLYQAKLGRGTLGQSVFSGAIFCGAKVAGANFSGASLTNAFFPIADTQIGDAAGDGGTTTTCAAIDLGPTATKLDDAMISTDATCPNSVPPVAGTGCTGSMWTPQNEAAHAVCPAGEGGIPPAKKAACKPCTSNCQCASQRCLQGICSVCRGDGG